MAASSLQEEICQARITFDVAVVSCMLHGNHRAVVILLLPSSPLIHAHIQTIQEQQGILFASPAHVHRVMYSGRGIIAHNTEFRPDLVDSRGYLPVEWWIMSKTEAKNAEPKENEGRWRRGVKVEERSEGGERRVGGRRDRRGVERGGESTDKQSALCCS